MASLSYVIEPLGKQHDKKAFSCGSEILDIYLQKQASQDIRRGIASVFVVVENGKDVIYGYYTLSTGSIPYMSLREDSQKAMPHYNSLPAIRLGRLAVDQSHQKQRLGQFMLLNAMYYALALPIAWQFFIVEAKPNAIAFYKKFGFLSCLDNDTYLYLTRKDTKTFCA